MIQPRCNLTVAYTMSVSSAENMLDVPAGTSKKTPSGLDGGLADSATPSTSLVQKAREALESQVKAITGWQPLCEGMARLLWDLYLTPSHGLNPPLSHSEPSTLAHHPLLGTLLHNRSQTRMSNHRQLIQTRLHPCSYYEIEPSR